MFAMVCSHNLNEAEQYWGANRYEAESKSRRIATKLLVTALRNGLLCIVYHAHAPGGVSVWCQVCPWITLTL